MNDDKKPWYQLRDSETKWYHHLMHGRVLIMLVLMAIVALLAIGIGIGRSWAHECFVCGLQATFEVLEVLITSLKCRVALS